MNNVTQLSSPLPVHMEDGWFDIATLHHFWIQRRFEVFKSLWKQSEISPTVAEVGCGHGLVMKQISNAFGVSVDGFDLNEIPLSQAIPDCGRLFCYNVHDRAASFEKAYETIFAFDVIEHLEDDRGFVESTIFHLKPGGHLIVNVPANQYLYSEYDRVAGHQRRYDIQMLETLCSATRLRIEKWSYWGPLYIPLLMVRKQMLKGTAKKDVIRQGFAQGSDFKNNLLLLLGRLDLLPNHVAGTSLMAILRKD